MGESARRGELAEASWRGLGGQGAALVFDEDEGAVDGLAQFAGGALAEGVLDAGEVLAGGDFAEEVGNQQHAQAGLIGHCAVGCR